MTFAFAGTFISAVSLGSILWLWTRVPFDGLSITFVEALSVGATLSATDPVTILAIFNVYKVEPKLYTVIFGESILNDAIAIVLFDTAQRYKEGSINGSLKVIHLFEAIGVFLGVFLASLLIGLVIGIGTALALKYTLVRRFPKIESCLIVLVAYASYFFSNAIKMSGGFFLSHDNGSFIDLTESQALSPSYFVELHSNITHTITCLDEHNSQQNSFSKLLHSCLKISSSYTLA